MLEHYQVIGVSHRNSSVEERSRFHLSGNRMQRIFDCLLNEDGYCGWVLSTCNRTEIYFSGVGTKTILDAWEKVTGLPAIDIPGIYQLSGTDCVLHLMRVASGAESQILGDHEITGQLRKAYKTARDLGSISGTWEKIINHAIASSRKIKRQTSFHEGNISLGYEISKILNKPENRNYRRALIIGAGDMSRNIIKNLSKYNSRVELHLANRTRSRSESLYNDMDIKLIDWANLHSSIFEMEIIISAIQSDGFTLPFPQKEDVENKIVFDLGVPRNFQTPLIFPSGNQYYFDLEILMKKTTNQIQKRKLELPKVDHILRRELNKFISWHKRRPSIIPSYIGEQTTPYAKTACG